LSNEFRQLKIELHQLIRSKSKTKDRKKIFSSPTKINKDSKTSNIQLQRTFSNLSHSSSFLSNTSEGKLQIYSNQNQQLSRNVQYQQESRCSQFISNNQENMVVNGQASNVYKSSVYPRKDKFHNRQTEPLGDEPIVNEFLEALGTQTL
jgi:hypothetical protein